MKRLLFWDMRFQMKYGFYFLYAVLTVFYLTLLAAFPKAWREDAAAILVFSDPAAMGLFFMGAIVLLEKSQRVLCAYAVSPMRVMKYTVSKVISLLVISELVAVILAMAAGQTHLIRLMVGTALSSILTTLAGLLIANRIQSLNQFILWTTPIEILVFVPALLYYFGALPEWMSIYPSCVCIQLIAGKAVTVPEVLALLAVVAGLGYLTIQKTELAWKRLGGAKL